MPIPPLVCGAADAAASPAAIRILHLPADLGFNGDPSAEFGQNGPIEYERVRGEPPRHCRGLDLLRG